MTYPKILYTFFSLHNKLKEYIFVVSEEFAWQLPRLREESAFIALFLGNGKSVIRSHLGQKRLISFDDKYKCNIFQNISK
jgi:hypothetical protein